MAWTQSGNIKGASGVPGASGASGSPGASGVPGATGPMGASGASGGTGGPGTTTWADITDKPGSILVYKGLWNAFSNSPSLSDSNGSGGDVYRVSTGGTRNLGSGSITWEVGDYAIYSPTNNAWEKADTTDAVSSVAGRTGDVVLTSADLGASGTASASTFLRGDNTWASGPIGATGATGASGGTGGTGALGASGPGFFRNITTLTTATTMGASGNTDYVTFLGASGIDSSTLLLITGDGPNNSTTILDSSPNLTTITVNGDTKISTVQSKYGSSSVYFDGTGDYLTASSSVAVTGSNAYTIEAWIYASAVTGGDRVIYETRGGSGFVLFINSTGNLQVFDSSAGLQTASTTALSANTWTHFALARAASSSTNTFYINGTSAGTFTLSSFAAATTTRIGARNDAAAAFTGYLDDFRVSNTARYTANFTPEQLTTFGVPTLPAASTANTNKSFYFFRNVSTSPITVGASGSQAINGATGGFVLASGSTVHLVSDGAGWYTL